MSGYIPRAMYGWNKKSGDHHAPHVEIQRRKKMNAAGLENKAGVLMKEVEELLVRSKKVRKDQARWKLAYEAAQQEIGNIEAKLYVKLTRSDDIEWAHPDPIVDSDGVKLPEFEAQFRSMLMNTLIQADDGFQALMATSVDSKKEYYFAERDERSLMEQIGIKKAQMGLVAALLRMADGS